MDINRAVSRKNSVIFSWIVSYIIVLIVPLVISVVVYSESLNALETETGQLNESLLMYIQQGVDNKLKDLEQISNEMMRNDRLGYLKDVKYPMSSSDLYYSITAINDLDTYKMGRKYIDSICVYSDNNGILFGQTGYVYVKELFAENNNFQGIKSKQWESVLESLHKNTFTPVGIEVDGKTRKVILYNRKISIDSKNLYAIFVINEENFLNIIQSAISNNNASLVILSQDRTVIASTGTEIPKFVMSHDFNNESGYIDKNISKNIFVTYITSNMNKWKYIMLSQTDIVWGKVKYIKTIINISVFLCIIIGVAIIYLATRRNYRPITDLVNSISKKLGISFLKDKNEFSFLQETILNTVDENDRIKIRLDQQNNLLKNHFLIRVIKGSPLNSIPVAEIQHEFDISFKSELFAVMVFYIEEVNNFANQFPDINEVVQILGLEMNKIIESLETKMDTTYVVDVDGMLACLINLPSSNKKESMARVERLASDLQQIIKEKFSVFVTISIGSLQTGIENINYSYKDALEAMQLKALKGSNTIITSDDIKNNRDYNTLITQIEIKLSNYMRSGDIEKAKNIISNYILLSVNNADGNVQMIKCVLLSFLGVMVKTLNEVDNEGSSKFIEELRPSDRLVKCDTVAHMRSVIFDTLESICTYIKQASNISSTNDKRLYLEIEKYINEHFSRSDLTLTMIGEFFGLTPYYLSRLFKDYSGQGMLEYINFIRIREAKNLLIESKNTIQEIANLIGYADVNTYIRQFKKFEGVTPGKYREIKGV